MSVRIDLVLSPLLFFRKKHYLLLTIVIICGLFATCYSTLSIVRHTQYASYGYDLGINDQTVWRYSRFEPPISTIAPFPDRSKLELHVELVYAFISPFYWLWSTRRFLLIISAIVLCSGGIATYLLAKYRLKGELISFSLTFSYLLFYGLQFAVWFDVHSTGFGAAFLMWFLLFLDKKNKYLSLVFFFLTITSKENMALYTLAIALLYLIRRREKIVLFFAGFSVAYLLFIFYVFFPHIMHVPYLYQNKDGLLSNINPLYLFNSAEKLRTLFYTFLSVGFLPLLNPLTVPLIMTHFATFFVIASDLPGAQGLFGHYRVTLGPLLTWSTIMTIATFKFLNKKYVAVYLFICALIVQYTLHLPLSYLTKSWFWTVPPSAYTINKIIRTYLPERVSVALQNNITPHLSHRDQIYTLYPSKKTFESSSPCGKKVCNWLSWYDHPEFVIVDTAKDWDIRHLLADRPVFLDALSNVEKSGELIRFKVEGTTILYKTR